MGKENENFSWSSLRLIDWVLVTLIVVGIGCVVWGLWQKNNEKKVEVEYLTVDEDQENIKIWVDIGGEVNNPGVYEVEKGSRLKDMIERAGGLTEEADKNYVSEILNLAEKVKDGEKIFIPSKGSDEEGVSGEVMGDSTGLININTANMDQLDTLWGIGEKRAQDIVDNRPYKETEELVEKKVIPESVYEKIKGELSVY